MNGSGPIGGNSRVAPSLCRMTQGDQAEQRWDFASKNRWHYAEPGRSTADETLSAKPRRGSISINVGTGCSELIESYVPTTGIPQK